MTRRLTFFRLLLSVLDLVLDPCYTSLSFFYITPLVFSESEIEDLRMHDRLHPF